MIMDNQNNLKVSPGTEPSIEDQLERRWIERELEENRFLNEIILRNKLGYQSAIIITGEPNSGKTVVGNLIKYMLTKGYFNERMDIRDYFFGIRALAKIVNKPDEINRVYLNDETSDELSVRNWNSINNTLWNLILSTQRIKKNIYINMMPHIRQLSRPHLILYNFVIEIDNFITEVKGSDNILLSREIVRLMKVNKIKVNYNFDNARDSSDFVKMMPYECYILPDYEKVKELEGFRKFMLNEHKAFELEGKARIADKISIIANMADIIDKKNLNKNVKEAQKSENLKKFFT
jgi:hypothetical protein